MHHIVCFLLGFLMDGLFGDPYWLPHPIRWIGKLISRLETRLLRETMSDREKWKRGVWLVVLVVGITGLVSAGILGAAYHIHSSLGMIVETIMSYQILAMKCLKVESMKVYRALKQGDVEGARAAVSMIVGRDTKVLDERGITKAAIETVAENTSDGVIAPLFYLALGGPILGFCYKAVNTLDSMVGYKNERYLYFGRAAAKLDDVVNWLPARISAYVMLAACFLLGEEFSGKRAYVIYQRDKYKHASPNSAHTEAVCAGALGIQLAGDASYFGKIVKKPYLGDAVRDVEYEDIRRANQLLYAAALLFALFCVLLMAIVAAVI